MNFKMFDLDSIKGLMYQTKFKIDKHSPELLLGAGIASMGLGVVKACKATLSADNVLREAKEELDGLKAIKNGEIETETEFTDDEMNKAIALSYVQTGTKLIKLYAPSVALLSLSVFCFVKSNAILSDRNVSLAAAYAAAQQGLKQYRKNVVDRFGEDVDKELRYGTHKETITETEVDENGKKKKVKKEIDVVNNLDDYSQYAKFFDETSKYWTKDPELNLHFLRLVQTEMNQKLQMNKILFLNEVYEALDIPKTKDGQIVGWRYDENYPTGDNFVDFGIYDSHKPAARDFVNGWERVILLDFNVDGDVYSYMPL